MKTEEINIADILRNEPAGTRLYSPACGALEFTNVTDGVIWCMEPGSSLTPHRISFTSYGKLINYGEWEFEGECLLFPAKELRDWDIYCWREGDVLESNDERNVVVFDKFTRSDRSRFAAHFCIENANTAGREYYRRAVEIPTRDYFNRHSLALRKEILGQIEERFCAPINRYTYKLHPNFEQGDFVVMEVSYTDSLCVHKYVCIFDCYDLQHNRMHCFADLKTGESDTPCINQIHDLRDSNDSVKNITLRFANGDEKAMLVNALHGEGKRWDGKAKVIVNEKRQIADNESEEESHKFELFDKVLVKGASENDTWFPGFFYKECKDSKEYRYVTICGKYYTYCIPYNDKTKHLVGTTLPYDED